VVSFMPGGMEFKQGMLPTLLLYVVALAICIAVVCAVPALIVVRLFRLFGIASHAMYAVAGSLIGLAALLAFLKFQGLSDGLSLWLEVTPPNEDTRAALLLAGSIVAMLAGAAAGLTYRLVTGRRA
jgi:hypothetical protein